MQAHIPASDELLTTAETAALLKVAPRTLGNLKRRGLLPSVRLTGKLVRYRRSDIERTLSELTVGVR